MRPWGGASSGIFLSKIKIFSDLIHKFCLSAALSAHGNILPGRNRPQELIFRTWRTAVMWNSCDASIHLSRSHWVNFIPDLQLDQGDCGETGKVLTLLSAWKIIRVYTGTLQFSGFWICNSCEDLSNNWLAPWAFCQKSPSKGIPFSSVLDSSLTGNVLSTLLAYPRTTPGWWFSSV